MYNPAIYHHDGKNETGESDMRAAVALLRKAARGGYASAQLKLGKQLYSAQARQAALRAHGGARLRRRRGRAAPVRGADGLPRGLLRGGAARRTLWLYQALTPGHVAAHRRAQLADVVAHVGRYKREGADGSEKK